MEQDEREYAFEVANQRPTSYQFPSPTPAERHRIREKLLNLVRAFDTMPNNTENAIGGIEYKIDEVSERINEQRRIYPEFIFCPNCNDYGSITCPISAKEGFDSSKMYHVIRCWGKNRNDEYRGYHQELYFGPEPTTAEKGKYFEGNGKYPGENVFLLCGREVIDKN